MTESQDDRNYEKKQIKQEMKKEKKVTTEQHEERSHDKKPIKQEGKKR